MEHKSVREATEVGDRARKLREATELLSHTLGLLPDTQYLVCAATHFDVDGKRKYCSVLYTNVHWHDDDGTERKPSVGMLTDLIIECKLSEDNYASNVNEERFGPVQPPASSLKQ
ncbi:MAG: hypothetical protein L0338_27895 [Acidobacteria bacterium]|nr:hypothetical protein [Acidobacteriota bacterium]